jgi:hypothetical protein
MVRVEAETDISHSKDGWMAACLVLDLGAQSGAIGYVGLPGILQPGVGLRQIFLACWHEIKVRWLALRKL